MSILLTIPRRLVKAGLLALMLVVIVFFGLTRTEVGRDALRGQIEQQFASRFDGRLTIGRLSGNLVQDVFASDVRLFDSQGRLVAAVDSAVFRPYWRDLFDRTVNSGRIILYRPVLHLVFDEAGPNLATIFRKASHAADEATPWSFRSADVRLIDGKIITSNDGYEDDWIDRRLVFDYSRLEAHDVNGRALVELRSGETVLNLRSLSMSLRQPSFRLDGLSGQLAIDDSTMEIRSLSLDAGGSRARLEATLPYRSAGTASAIELALLDARVDFDSLRTLIPALPLADRATLSARVHGTMESLVIEEAVAERGGSSMHLSGTIIGMPARMDYEVAVADARLHPEDVQAVLPGSDLAILERAGSVRGDVYASGTALPASGDGRPAITGEGTIRLISPHGRMDGPFIVARDSTVDFGITAELNLRRVMASRLLPEFGGARSEVTGRVQVDARRLRDAALNGTATASLSRSWIGGHELDSISLRLNVDERGLSARGFATQGDAYAALVGGYGDGLLDAQLIVRDLDAGRWWLRGDSIRTRLNAMVSLNAAGASLDALDGSLVAEVRPSEIWHGARHQTIPEHRHVARFQQSGATPFLSLTGDVLELDLRSDAPLRSVNRAVAAWRPIMDDVLERERLRRLRPDADTLHMEHHLPASGRGHAPPVRLTADGRVLNSRILGVIYPDLEGIETDLRLGAELRMNDRGLALSAGLGGDSLVAGALRADGLQADVRFAARMDSSGIPRTDLFVHSRSDSIVAGGQHFLQAAAELQLAGGVGSLELQSYGNDPEEALHLLAAISTTDDVRRLHLEEFRLAADSYEWTLDGRPAIDLYDDAMVVRALQVHSMSSRATQPQRIRFDGVLSTDPRDTLSAYIEQVRIGEISDMLNMRYTIEGELNGRVALTGLGHQPELTGHLEVAEARFDRRPVGRVDVRSMYVAGRPDIILDARITPPESESDVDAPRNDLRLYGAIRLPVPGPDRRMADPGRIDLDLDVAHADAFFFDYIFREIDGARGVLNGDGAIRGDFRRPVFEARLRLRDGGMRIPDFNLAYNVEGAVVVDSTAIRLNSVDVRDATGGHAIVDGDILFNEYRFFSFDLRAALNETQFMNVSSSRDMGFYGDVRASGNVTLRGPLDSATLSSSDAVIHPDSRVYIAIMEEMEVGDAGFIVFADSTGEVPATSRILRRHVLSQRPEGERMFVDGLEMDLNILASQGTNVHLVIDPVLGDVINATASGRIQLLRTEGDYFTYGTLNVDSGDYLFTAGDVFVRRFLIDGGSIAWDGDPANAALDIQASYRTRASAAGLNIAASDRLRIPLIVRMDITGRVAAPAVGLRLLIDRDSRESITSYESLESILNQPERSAEYATSVMLTNSFMLTTSIASSGEAGLATTRNQLAFNSLSQLVATQLNRYLSQALPNVDVNLGLQGESTQDLDVTYGVALRLLDERLVIRGQGLYQNEAYRNMQQNLLDEFVVEVRVSSSVSVEVFYRRENDILASDHTLANTTGAGLSYETQFSSWNRLIQRLLRRSEQDAPPSGEVLAGADDDPPEDD